ncbi:MAG: hypothetical protein JSR46_07860, partial [Verrucomicrobia bacterium]|nr:hypothetical protein [Verrucomicrobiota bacterium]
MQPVVKGFINLNPLAFQNRPKQEEQTENPVPMSVCQNCPLQEQRFASLHSQGLIDNSGIASDAFKNVKLDPISKTSKKNINGILNQTISPKKDLGSIPQQKVDLIIPIFNRLLSKYGSFFPFSFHQQANCVLFHIQFTIKQLVSFIKSKIKIDNEIELIGSGAAAALGAGYYERMINSW